MLACNGNRYYETPCITILGQVFLYYELNDSRPFIKFLLGDCLFVFTISNEGAYLTFQSIFHKALKDGIIGSITLIVLHRHITHQQKNTAWLGVQFPLYTSALNMSSLLLLYHQNKHVI